MNILLITDVIHLGGAELFVLRLGEEFRRNHHNVHLFILRSDKIDNSVKQIIAPALPVISPTISFFRLWNKIDGLLYKLHIPFSIVRNFHTINIKKAIRDNNIDILHSHLFTSDLIAMTASKQMNVPFISTMHGDYLLYSNSESARKVARLVNFDALLKKVLKNVSAIICIADEQISQIKTLKDKYKSSFMFKKVYNGYQEPVHSSDINRKKLAIAEDAFVIGMVARGIKEKGWGELVEGFKMAAIPRSVLLLIGQGHFLNELKKKYSEDQSIIFTGSVHYPTDYIKLMDVACLPSYFASESLPTVVIEYLICGKPVIASNKGEIPIMLRIESDEPAGILVDITKKKAIASSICNAIVSFAHNTVLLRKYSDNAKKAAGIFDMKKCATIYKNIYEQAISRY